MEGRLNEKCFGQFAASYYKHGNYIIVYMANITAFMVYILFNWSDILLLTLVTSLFHTFN